VPCAFRSGPSTSALVFGAVSPMARLVAAAACFAGWLVLLFLGYAAGGAVHLLAVAGVLLAPWRTTSHSTEES
jgi:hypothetical protein